MREIKFRAWDKDKKLMQEVVLIDIRNKDVLVSMPSENEEKLLEFDDIILMQYTGLIFGYYTSRFSCFSCPWVLMPNYGWFQIWSSLNTIIPPIVILLSVWVDVGGGGK